VPFDTNNISSATYQRIHAALPNVYGQIERIVKGVGK